MGLGAIADVWIIQFLRKIFSLSTNLRKVVGTATFQQYFSVGITRGAVGF
jgi:hypothetical protein